ncbi:LruC domain-containing protein [Negadavirga shengliensis]|uniref:LruC domain-containing protein n=1 Tax=Negadavirga shengliensis TaxID=1389218 RepID=A0ABV9T5T6_9BACT
MRNILVIVFIGLGIVSSNAQNMVRNDAELGDRNLYLASCWSMNGVTVSGEASTLVSGSFSFRTNPVVSESATAVWIKSPWLNPEAGNITVKTRLDGNSGGNRAVVFQYVTFNGSNGGTGEGNAVEFARFDFPNPINNQTSVHNVSVAVPAAVIGQPHKILISFTGTGGSARIGLDDWVIPGKYNVDPSKNCFPLIDEVDSDGDGVPDEEDDYPNDPFRAYNNYFPSKNFGTLMFEDLWPALGDYDFNDLVVDYRINRVTDADGEVVEVITELKTRAAGAGFRNGFGIEFTGLAPDRIIAVEGTKIKTESIHVFAPNGLEAGTEYVTFIPYDDAHNVLTHPGGGSIGINTDPNFPLQKPVTQTVILTLKKDGQAAIGGATSLAEVGMGNFNPFLISNQNRQLEVHLPGKTPTALADKSLMGTKDDGSQSGVSNSYYKSKETNLPWAMNISESIPYMVDKVDVTQGYRKFFDWVVSGGSMYADWYLDLPGHRDNGVLLNAQ